MRVVIQRALRASVTINGCVFSEINRGLLIFVGIESQDVLEDINWVIHKVLNLRIFNDDAGIMNISVKDVVGEILLISQFTLHASTKKGNRPSYIKSAKPEIAKPIFEQLALEFEKKHPNKIKTGKFGADMKVSLLNDGPVTIIIDTKNKE